MRTTVWVGNLPDDATDRAVFKAFEKACGRVIEAKVKQGGAGTYALINFDDEAGFQSALKQDGEELCGSKGLKVKEAKEVVPPEREESKGHKGYSKGGDDSYKGGSKGSWKGYYGKDSYSYYDGKGGSGYEKGGWPSGGYNSAGWNTSSWSGASWGKDGKGDNSDNVQLWIGGLPEKLEKEELAAAFKKFGTIVEAMVHRAKDAATDAFGFVTFQRHGDAEAAKEAVSGAEHFGKPIVVKWANQPKGHDKGNGKSYDKGAGKGYDIGVGKGSWHQSWHQDGGRDRSPRGASRRSRSRSPPRAREQRAAVSLRPKSQTARRSERDDELPAERRAAERRPAERRPAERRPAERSRSRPQPARGAEATDRGGTACGAFRDVARDAARAKAPDVGRDGASRRPAARKELPPEEDEELEEEGSSASEGEAEAPPTLARRPERRAAPPPAAEEDEYEEEEEEEEASDEEEEEDSASASAKRAPATRPAAPKAKQRARSPLREVATKSQAPRKEAASGREPARPAKEIASRRAPAATKGSRPVAGRERREEASRSPVPPKRSAREAPREVPREAPREAPQERREVLEEALPPSRKRDAAPPRARSREKGATSKEAPREETSDRTRREEGRPEKGEKERDRTKEAVEPSVNSKAVAASGVSKVRVLNLPPDMTTEELKLVAKDFGKVLSVSISSKLKEGARWGSLAFGDAQSAALALKKLDRRRIEGWDRRLSVSLEGA